MTCVLNSFKLQPLTHIDKATYIQCMKKANTQKKRKLMRQA